MQTAKFGQAVAFLFAAALAAGCSATKEYSSKLFAPRAATEKDSTVTALRFLEMDESEQDPGSWVSTDIIMGRDTANSSLVLDNFSKTYPANGTVTPKTDSVTHNREKDIKPVYVNAKPAPVTSDPVAKSSPDGTVRAKKSRED